MGPIRKPEMRAFELTRAEGSVLAEGALEEVQADARVIEVYLGR